jgi:hypothetical protein
MEKTGTIIFLDTEGGDAIGDNTTPKSLIVAMQLLALSLSSHISFVIPNTVDRTIIE